MILFTVMDHDVLTFNDFAGEAYLSLNQVSRAKLPSVFILYGKCIYKVVNLYFSIINVTGLTLNQVRRLCFIFVEFEIRSVCPVLATL